MSIINIYKEQDDIIISQKYKSYIKYLELYYNNTEKSNIYNKKIDDNGNFILIDKQKKNNIITIQKSHIIDINNYYNKLNNKINIIYNSISELINNMYMDDIFKKKEIEKLKEEYKKIIIDLNNIKEIFKIQSSKLFKLNEEKLNLEIELANLYINRKKSFNKIKPINIKSKKNIINTFKKDMKIPNNDMIKSLSLNIDLSIDEIKDWFNWINISYLYINYQMKINKLTHLIKENIKNNNKINENFIMNKPDFNEKKHVSI